MTGAKPLQVHSAWWIISQLMKRMGLPGAEHVPDDDRVVGADDTMLAALMQGARASFEEVAAVGCATRPLELPARWVDNHIERMGGWKLAPSKLVELWEQTRRADEAVLGQPRPLCFIPRRQRRKLNASLSFLGSPADILLHPDDAAARNITHGQAVRVQTSCGEIQLAANVDVAMRKGVASIPHGHEIANVNFLTSAGHVDEMTGMVRYTGIPIEVEAVAA